MAGDDPQQLKILWSVPIRGERLDSSRGDVVRARSLIHALRQQGHDVIVAEDAAELSSRAAVFGYRRFVKNVLPAGAAMILRDLGRWTHSRKHAKRVTSVARQERPQILIETQVGFAVSGALIARNTQLPFILDDCSPSSEESVLGAGLPWFAQRIFKKQVEWATLVIAVCESAREALIAEGVPAEKIRVVSNSIDLKAYDRADTLKIREQFGLQNRKLLVFAGSFMPWHHAALLIRTLSRLKDRNVHLLLAGEGPELADVLRLADEMQLGSCITSLGSVASDTLPEVLRAADIGVLPGTNRYGQPMKLLEYAAAGIPAVAPDLPPVREIVQPDLTGILFEPDNLDNFLQAIQALLSNPALAQSLGQNARSRIEGESWMMRSRILSGYIAEMVAR